jgi:hypothetical protein
MSVHHWTCRSGDELPPNYFNPPISPNGVPVLTVTAFHRLIPGGHNFVRRALGEPWIKLP